jgi:GT2 family glycosyltransferase
MNKTIISIVLYENSIIEIEKLLECLLGVEVDIEVFFFDNSQSSNIYRKDLLSNLKNIHYVDLDQNLGFGGGHNLILEQPNIKDNATLIIMNPDILFDSKNFIYIINYFNKENGVSALMPNVLNFDGSVQILQKKIPNPVALFLKKILFFKCYQNYYERVFCLKKKSMKSDIFEVDILSGCFLVTNFNNFKTLGGFDERFFLYFEDWDLSRRLNKLGKLIYLGNTSVYHEHKSEANFKWIPFKYFLKSYCYFFYKWIFLKHFKNEL